MRDAVADVLMQREALARREPSGLLASIVLHAILVAILVFASRPRPTPPPAQVLTVRLSPAAAGKREVRAAVSTAKPALKTEEAKKTEEPKKAPPALKDQETLFGRATQPKGKPTEAPPKPEPVKPEPDTQGATFGETARGIGTLPGVGAAGIAGIEGNFPYNFYLERMVTLIGNNWLRPETGADITVVVYFTVERNGAIKNVEIRKSSGSGTFDRAAMRSVIESSPLPKLPPGYRGEFLGVHLTFH